MDKGELVNINEIKQIDLAIERMIRSPQCNIVDIFPEQIPESTMW